MIFNWFLGVALVAAPFFIKVARQITPSASQAFFLLLAAFIGALIFGVKTENIRVKVLALSLFAVAFTGPDPFGLFGYYQLVMCISGLLFYGVLEKNLAPYHLKLATRALALVCLFESAWIAVNYLGFEPYAWFIKLTNDNVTIGNSGARVFGSVGNVNHSAALVAATFVFLRPTFWAIPFAALFLAKSALPAICAAVALVTYYSYKNRSYLAFKIMGAALFAAALCLLFGNLRSDNFFYGTERVAAWTALYDMVGIQLWGKGLGFVSTEFAQYFSASQIFMQMHNEWLEAYAIAGLVGVAVMAFVLLPAFKNKGAYSLNACMVSLLVNSLGNFTFHIAPLFMVFATCYALNYKRRS